MVCPALTSSAKATSAELEQHAESAFGFLRDEHGAKFRAERQSHRTVLAYVLPAIFFEVELDWREAAVFLLLGRTIEGRRPKGYYVDESGRKVRWHLVAVLDRDGPVCRAIAADLRRVARGSGPDAMAAQIDRFAAALREVLAELPRLLDNLPT